MDNSETLPGEITQTCPVVRPPNPEPTQSSTAGAWKGLVASTAVVMAVGGAAVGVNSLQADTRVLYTEMIHLAANRSTAVPASSPAVGSLAVAERPSSQASAPPQVQAPAAAPVTRGSQATQESQVPASDRKTAIDEPVNGSVIDDDFVQVSGRLDPSVKGDPWVLVYPHRAPGRGWPQSGDASRGVSAVRHGDQFQVGAFLGGPPQMYDIVVYSTTSEASRLFSAYLQQASLSGKHTGISSVDMPSGLQELARVTIRRAPSHH